MTADFWLSDTFQVIKLMKATGNRPGIILRWKALVQTWALDNAGTAEAKAINAWLPYWQVRPFYTAAELAPIFPALAVTFGIAKRPTPQRSPSRLENELHMGGLPMLHNRDSEDLNFRNPKTGQLDHYWIVERLHHWRYRGWTQAEFEKEFP